MAEVAALKVADIDSERMLIRIERGKGGQYRNAMLAADLLTLLREWWRAGRQQGVMHREGWLFPGQHATKPISTRQLHRVVVEAAHAADIAVNSRAIVTPEGRFLRPILTPSDAMSVFLSFGLWRPGRAFGDDGCGPDRRDTSGLFRAAAADQGDCSGIVGVADDGAPGDLSTGTEVSLIVGV